MYGADSWDNICGYDNSRRPGSELIRSSNAGLDMTNRPHQYYTDPKSDSAPILCVEECPTRTTLEKAYPGFKGNKKSQITCDPYDSYCQRFCMGPGAPTAIGSLGSESGSGSSESVGKNVVRGSDKHPNPYGLYPADENNRYMTNNHDRGNCYDYDDTGSSACDVKLVANASDVEQQREDAKNTLDELGSLFDDLGTAARKAAFEALGFGERDDWDTGKVYFIDSNSGDGSGATAKYDWTACKPPLSTNLSDTVDNPACPNDGCPRRIHASYDLSMYSWVCVAYTPCMLAVFV